KCPSGAATCSVYDYDLFVGVVTDPNPEPMVSAVVIHDLHGLTRTQLLDPAGEVVREVLINTGEITDYNYANGLLRGVLAPSGVRTCLERDANGRITQSSTVPASGYGGTAITQATTMAYNSIGRVTDVVHDALGTPVRTHYERDPATSRVVRIDQDVRS